MTDATTDPLTTGSPWPTTDHSMRGDDRTPIAQALGQSRHFRTAASQLEGYTELVESVAALAASPALEVSTRDDNQDNLNEAHAVMNGADPLDLATARSQRDERERIAGRARLLVGFALDLSWSRAWTWVDRNATSITRSLTVRLQALIDEIAALAEGELREVRAAGDLEQHPAAAPAWARSMAAAREALELIDLARITARAYGDAAQPPMLYVIHPDVYSDLNPSWWRGETFELYHWRTERLLGLEYREAPPWAVDRTDPTGATLEFVRWLADHRARVWVPFQADYLKAREAIGQRIIARREEAARDAAAALDGSRPPGDLPGGVPYLDVDDDY